MNKYLQWLLPPVLVLLVLRFDLGGGNSVNETAEHRLAAKPQIIFLAKQSSTAVLLTDRESIVLRDASGANSDTSIPSGSILPSAPPTDDGKSILIDQTSSRVCVGPFTGMHQREKILERIEDKGLFFTLQRCLVTFALWFQRISYSWLSRYHALLQEYPIVTKSLTGGVIGILGDILAQVVIEQRRIRGTPQKQRRLDLYRTLTLTIEGVFVSGPLLHYAYDWMDELVVSGLGYDADEEASATFLSSLVQVILDLVLMDSFFVATLMMTSAILQGHGRKQILHELGTEFVPAVKISWLSSFFMSPLQFFNFRYLPVEFRVLLTNLQDVVWEAVVSFMAHRGRRERKPSHQATKDVADESPRGALRESPAWSTKRDRK
jgi:protein Mpv17